MVSQWVVRREGHPARERSITIDTLDAAIAAKKRHTPKRGVNLCEIDDFEFPPNNLIYLNSFADEADAREAAEYEYPETQKFVMLFADGSGIGIDKSNPAAK